MSAESLPIIVGVGQITVRDESLDALSTPLDLMERAAEAAAAPEPPPAADTAPVGVPVPETKPDPLNDHRPITFEIWAALVCGLFALAVIWLIFG